MVKRAEQNSGKLCLGEAMKTKLSRKEQAKSFPSDIIQIYFIYSTTFGFSGRLLFSLFPPYSMYPISRAIMSFRSNKILSLYS